MKAKFLAVIAVAVAAASYGYSKFTQPKIVAWGDSLTFGVGAKGYHGYPDYLKDDGYEVIKRGYPGQASSDIALRQGGLSPTIFTAKLSQGNYSVTSGIDGDFKKYIEVSYQGTINGVPVTLKRAKDNSWTVSSEEILDCEKGCKFTSSETIETKNGIYIFWVGRNNNLSFPKFVFRDIDLMVKSLPEGSKYLVLGITPSRNDTKEQFKSILFINDNLSKAYGENFIDMREVLHERGMDMANLMPSLQDVDSMLNGTISPRLYSDQVHFNDLGYDVIARIIKRRL
ncbi:SGNH/GDSL hydrolase family protein [Lelliottia amnigena]|uniref:SGNH/GDSL hydrolase family protein n=1 Tax=Lelliottia amnigena TaxID=61646 RepID=UPI00192B0F16|nr:SGNH/GDSL hydrolase family protein [Lelliottia amnigena]MBL5931040.1 SGNH/GDSL hydrolase family protein [Lelliottia amnigena]